MLMVSGDRSETTIIIKSDITQHHIAIQVI